MDDLGGKKPPIFGNDHIIYIYNINSYESPTYTHTRTMKVHYS